MVDPNSPPSGDAAAELELVRLINLPERADDYVGPSILDGEGVNPRFIDACRTQIARIDQTYENTFPRDPQGITYKFFEGEARDSGLSSAINPINNPFSVLRPRVLTSPSNMAHYGLGPNQYGPKYYAQSASERGWNDNDLENAYRRGVRAYEELFVAVLEATNQDNFAASLEVVEPVLQNIIGIANQQTIAGRNPFSRETAAGWLMHASLAVLIHPSEHIRPAGRLRALTLLSRYSTEELATGFMPARDGRGNIYHSGVGNFLPARIPHTMCPPHLRAAAEHENWEHEPSMEAIFSELRSRDYRTTIQKPLQPRTTTEAK